jgi:subtilisin family serine protease
LSLGGGKNQAANDIVKSLTDNGIHVACAAGNDGGDACNISPASEPTAITVGATELTNDEVTNFSDTGECVDIFAPGRDIKSAGIESNDDTKVFSGTSQATPHVAGTIALIISEFGNPSVAEMAKSLNGFATKGVIPENTLRGSPNVFLRVPFADNKNCNNHKHYNHHNHHYHHEHHEHHEHY